MRLPIAVLALLLLSCADQGREAERFFGETAFRCIDKATSVQCARIESYVNESEMKRGVWVNPGEAWLRLYALLQNPASYDWTRSVVAKPEFVLRLLCDQHIVDVYVSLTERALSIAVSGDAQRKWASIAPSAARYAQVLQAVLPAQKN